MLSSFEAECRSAKKGSLRVFYAQGLPTLLFDLSNFSDPRISGQENKRFTLAGVPAYDAFLAKEQGILPGG
jgi:hypothetical protein